MNSVGHLETLAYLTCMYDHFISDFEISLYDYTYVFFFYLFFFSCGKAICRLPISMSSGLFKDFNADVFICE